MHTSLPPESGALAGLIDATGGDPMRFWIELADTLTEAVLVVGADRRILYGNAPAVQLMNGSLADSQHRLCLDVISCPQCECMCRLFEEGKVDNVEVSVYRPGECEPRSFRKNGRLVRDATGNVIGGIETFTDISAELAEHAENQRRGHLLLREKRRSAALVGSLCEGIFSVNESGRLCHISDKLSQLTGFRDDAALGSHVLDLFGLRAALPDASAIRAAVGRPFPVRLRRASGRPIDATVTFVETPLGADPFLGVVRAGTDGDVQRPDEVEREISQLERDHCFHGLVSQDPAMERVFELLRNAAAADVRVLIAGESGTGKELAARALHNLSERSTEPWFGINCATFAGGMLLSELFGHARGSFTGAVDTRRGKLELAGRGTLLLDEVAEIPLEHQALLLRVLEEGSFLPVGGERPVPLRARVIAATNCDLERAVKAGRFRADLYYRLNVVPVTLPPLRERGGDISLLSRYFALRSARRAGRVPHELAPEVLRALEAYPWPGNVRELRNVIDYVDFAAQGRVTIDHLPSYVLQRSHERPTGQPQATTPRECDRILAALEANGYRKARTAAALGWNRTTLWRKMRAYGLADRPPEPQ